MVEVELSRIIIDEQKGEQLIVLKEAKGERILPIVIGISEAAAIKMHISDFSPPRPMTHDLLCSVFSEVGVRLELIVIDKLLDSTFHAKLYLRLGIGGLKIIDARPSDSIALAVRTKSPMFVEDEVFDNMAK
ncbi:MAG: bifunctional nuclease family protein [Candidatus Omnitrophota bacterium]